MESMGECIDSEEIYCSAGNAAIKSHLTEKFYIILRARMFDDQYIFVVRRR